MLREAYSSEQQVTMKTKKLEAPAIIPEEK